MKQLIFVFLGMFLMYVLLKILSSRVTESSMTTERLKDLVKTPQVNSLIKTNEFSNVIKTPEFSAFLKTLANEQMNAISKTLITY